MKLRVVALTPEHWPRFADLMQDGGPCSRCWCMYWRIGSAYRRHAASENRDSFHAVVQTGPPPGLLALQDDRAIGWCQLTPRADLTGLARSRDLKPVDGAPVWCVSCFYIRKGFRRSGITEALVREAIRVTKQAGAPALEAYPLDATKTPSASFTGFLSTFERLGFQEVARRSHGRPIVRYSFTS